MTPVAEPIERQNDSHGWLAEQAKLLRSFQADPKIS
jgi:hypothetical protein